MTDQDGILTREALQKFFHTLKNESSAPSNLIPPELTTPEWRALVEQRKEAYRTAMQQIEARCKAHKSDTGEYPHTLEADGLTFEALRAGTHTDSNATQIVIPLLYEDAPIMTVFPQLVDAVKPLWFVLITKAEKPV